MREFQTVTWGVSTPSASETLNLMVNNDEYLRERVESQPRGILAYGTKDDVINIQINGQDVAAFNFNVSFEANRVLHVAFKSRSKNAGNSNNDTLNGNWVYLNHLWQVSNTSLFSSSPGNKLTEIYATPPSGERAFTWIESPTLGTFTSDLFVTNAAGSCEFTILLQNNLGWSPIYEEASGPGGQIEAWVEDIGSSNA